MRPCESMRKAQRYARFGSAKEVNLGAGISFPSLRIATPFAVPRSNSEKSDSRHLRVCSAKVERGAISPIAITHTSNCRELINPKLLLKLTSFYDYGQCAFAGDYLMHCRKPRACQ